MRATLLLLAVVLCSPAGAAGRAVIEATQTGGPMTLSWRNAETVRLDMPGQPGYMVVRDGQAYMVSNMGGQPVVMDMGSMARLAFGPNRPQVPATAANARAVGALKATDRSETVAGIEGTVYQVTWTDANGDRRTDEAVLSGAPGAVHMTAAFRGLTNAMAESMGVDTGDALGKALAERELGVLRFGQRFRVKQLSTQAPADGTFRLPAQPMRLPAAPGSAAGRSAAD